MRYRVCLTQHRARLRRQRRRPRRRRATARSTRGSYPRRSHRACCRQCRWHCQPCGVMFGTVRAAPRPPLSALRGNFLCCSGQVPRRYAVGHCQPFGVILGTVPRRYAPRDCQSYGVIFAVPRLSLRLRWRPRLREAWSRRLPRGCGNVRTVAGHRYHIKTNRSRRPVRLRGRSPRKGMDVATGWAQYVVTVPATVTSVRGRPSRAAPTVTRPRRRPFCRICGKGVAEKGSGSGRPSSLSPCAH